jgi:hypothetical protein
LSLAPWDLRGWLGADCYSKVPSADSGLVPGRFWLAQLVPRDGCSHRLPRHECGALSGFWNSIVSVARHAPSNQFPRPSPWTRLSAGHNLIISHQYLGQNTRWPKSVSLHPVPYREQNWICPGFLYVQPSRETNGTSHLLFCGLCDATNLAARGPRRENPDAQRAGGPWLPACLQSLLSRMYKPASTRCRLTMRSEQTTTSQPIDAAHSGDHETARIAPRNTSS